MKVFSLRLSDELAEAVDAVRGDVPLSVWVRRAIEQALGGVLLKAASELPGYAERAEEVREALRSEPAEPPQPSPQRSPMRQHSPTCRCAMCS